MIDTHGVDVGSGLHKTVDLSHVPTKRCDMEGCEAMLRDQSLHCLRDGNLLATMGDTALGFPRTRLLPAPSSRCTQSATNPSRVRGDIIRETRGVCRPSFVEELQSRLIVVVPQSRLGSREKKDDVAQELLRRIHQGCHSIGVLLVAKRCKVGKLKPSGNRAVVILDRHKNVEVVCVLPDEFTTILAVAGNLYRAPDVVILHVIVLVVRHLSYWREIC